MSDDDLTRQYYQDMLQDAQRILRGVDQMIDGTAGPVLATADWGWLRAAILDVIERAETALGLPHSQEPDSMRRTIRLGALSATPEQFDLAKLWREQDERPGEGK